MTKGQDELEICRQLRGLDLLHYVSKLDERTATCLLCFPRDPNPHVWIAKVAILQTFMNRLGWNGMGIVPPRSNFVEKHLTNIRQAIINYLMSVTSDTPVPFAETVLSSAMEVSEMLPAALLTIRGLISNIEPEQLNEVYNACQSLLKYGTFPRTELIDYTLSDILALIEDS